MFDVKALVTVTPKSPPVRVSTPARLFMVRAVPVAFVYLKLVPLTDAEDTSVIASTLVASMVVPVKLDAPKLVI